MQPALNTVEQQNAITMLAMGETNTHVAQQLGVSQPTVSRLAKRERIAINATALAIIAKSRKLILDNHVRTLTLANRILSATDRDSAAIQDLMCTLSRIGVDPKDILTVADKKEYRTLQIMGIVPTHTQSTVINNIFNQSTVINNPKVIAILDREKQRQLEHVDLPDLGLDSD